MSVAIVVERVLPRDAISTEEWVSIATCDSDLRIRNSPYLAINPKTGTRIQIPAGPADSEILVKGQWEPFLRLQQGTLTIEYQDKFEDTNDPIRRKIAAIARRLGAIIRTDADDETLSW